MMAKALLLVGEPLIVRLVLKVDLYYSLTSNPIITVFHSFGWSFPFYMEMLFLIWRELGMGKFPHSSRKAHSCFPIHSLAVIVKKNFLIRGFAAHEEIIFHYSC